MLIALCVNAADVPKVGIKTSWLTTGAFNKVLKIAIEVELVANLEMHH